MIKLLSSLIEDKIIAHHDDNFYYLKDENEVKFTFQGAKILVIYHYEHEQVTYKNENVEAEFKGQSYSTEDKEHFQIRRDDPNPNTKPLQYWIDKTIERETKAQEEQQDD